MPHVPGLLQRQHLNPIPAPAVPAPAAVDGQAVAGRSYVGVHNLHQGNAYASLFQQVIPSNAQLVDRLGEKSLKYISLEPDAQGVPQVQLRLKDATTERAAKANAKAVQAEFAAARDVLWDTTKEFDDQLHQIQGQERNRDLAQKPFYARWFGKIRDFVHGGAPPPVSLQLRFEAGQGEQKEYRSGRLMVATTDEAGRAMMAEARQHAAQANAAAQAPADVQPPGLIPGQQPAQPDDDARIRSFEGRKYKSDGFDNKHQARRAGWLAGGALVGGLGAAMMLTAGTVAAAAGTALLAPVLVGGGIALAAGVGVMALRARVYKTPWWGKTATGQLQHAERQQARDVAAEVAKVVKQQVLRGAQAASNVEVPAGQLHKRFLVDDPKAVSDFVRLAREKNHDGLKKLVKAELQKADQSFLNESTIGQSKIGFLRALVSFNNEAAHARKTMDIAVREIVRGIEQGVAEGVLQTVVGELIDTQSVKAEQAITAATKQRFDDFQNAVRVLEPRQSDDFHEIFEVDQHLQGLQRLQDQVVENGQALSPTEKVAQQLGAAADTIGEANIISYRDALRKLDHDIQAHIDSLGDARRLLLPSAPGQGPAQADDTNLDGVLNEMKAALADVEQQDPAAVKQTYDDLAQSLQDLRTRLADANQTPHLIEVHAQKVKGLIDRCEAAVSNARQVSETLSNAHHALRQPQLSLRQVEMTLKGLEQLNDQALRVDMDPTKKHNINASIIQAQTETRRLIDLCEGINRAQATSVKLEGLAQQIRSVAAQGGLARALQSQELQEFKTEIKSQQQDLKAWTDAGFQVPDALREWGAADEAQLGVDLAADVLGLDQQQRGDMKPLLQRLVGVDERLMSGLTAVQNRDHRIQLLQALQAHLPPAGVPPESSAAQEAALACHTAALAGNVVLGRNNDDMSALVQALHPAQTGLLQKQQRALEADQALWNAFHGQGGDTIEAWVEDRGLLNLPPLVDGAGQHQPFNAARKLAALKAFVEAHPNLDGQAGLLKTLEGAATVWNTERRFREMAASEQRLGLSQIDAQTLRGVQGMVEALQAPVSAAVEKVRARRREQELQALALAQQAAQELAPGKANDPEAVKASVRQGLQPKSPEAALQLEALLPEIGKMMVNLEANQNDQEVQAQRLRNLADGLKTLINSNDSVETLTRRVVEQPQIRAELAALIYANQALRGSAVPDFFNSALSKEVVTQSARDLAGFSPLGPVDQDALEKSLGSQEWTPLKQRLDDRQAQAQRLRDSSTNTVLPDGKLRKDLAGQPELDHFVRTYHDEGLAYQALWVVAKQDPKASGRHVRSIIEGSATHQQDRLAQGTLNRAQVLSAAHCKTVHEDVSQLLQQRLQAVTDLQALLTDKYGASELKYLQDQIQALQGTLEQLDQIDPLQAFSKPESGQLAALGGLIRECEPFRGKSKPDIQKAYLSEQVAISRKALQWFDLKHFSQANGLFSKVLFTLVGKGKRLNQLLNEQQSTRAVDIAKASTQIARTAQLGTELRRQGAALQEMFNDLQAQRNSLIQKPEHVITSLRMLAARHLATKEGEAPTLSAQDLEVVQAQWESLVGQSAAKLVPDLSLNLLLFQNKGAKSLLSAMNPSERDAVATQLQALQEKDEAVRRSHQALRNAVNAADVEGSKSGSDRELKQLLVRAGLDTTAMELVQKATSGGENTERLNQIKDRLVEWALLRQDLSVGTDMPPLVVRATEIKQKLEGLLGGVANEGRRAAMRGLIQELEYNLLEGMGPSAPVSLPSIDTDSYRSSYGLLTELRGRFNGELKGEPLVKQARAFASKQLLPEPPVVEPSPIPFDGIEGVAAAERQVLSLWAQAGAGLFAEGAGSKLPGHWMLMDRLAESRYQLGGICLALSDDMGEQAKKVEQDKKKQNQTKLIELKAKQVQLKERAQAHLQAALVAGSSVAGQMRQWYGSNEVASLLPTFATHCMQAKFWDSSTSKAGINLPPASGRVGPAHVQQMAQLDERAFGHRTDQTTDEFARFERNQNLMGGMLQPSRR